MNVFDHTPHSAAAAERCSFQLTYERSPAPRHFDVAGITGPDIANAWYDENNEFSCERSCGEWDNGGETPMSEIESQLEDDEMYDENGFPVEDEALDFALEVEVLKADPEQDVWIEHYLSMALTEGVHEVLEWFKVDGKSFIDPHGSYETRIYKIVKEFTTELLKMRKTTESIRRRVDKNAVTA